MHVSRTIRSCFLVAAFILFSSTAWCAESENPLLGRWLVQRVGVRDATKLPIQIEWDFTKDKVIVRDITNSQEVSRNSYTVDVTKNPKWITATVVDKVTELRLGIFRIVDEELHLSQAVGGGVRPTNFVDGSYLILKRQTAKKDQK